MPAGSMAVLGVNDVIDQVSAARASCNTCRAGRRSPGRGRATWRSQAHAASALPAAAAATRHVMGPTGMKRCGGWAGHRARCLAPGRSRLGLEHMAPDGFLGGEPVYRATGEALARRIGRPPPSPEPSRPQGASRCSSPAPRPASAWRSRCAPRAMANVVIAAKTAVTNPWLPGTIHSAAAGPRIEAPAALGAQTDIRDGQRARRAGGADRGAFRWHRHPVNNASAVWPAWRPTPPMEALRPDVRRQRRGAAPTTPRPACRRSAAQAEYQC